MNEQEFVQQLTQVKNAEKEMEKLIQEAHKKAEKVIGQAQEESKNILEKAREEASLLEQGIIDEGKKEIEKEENRIISKAENSAQKILSAKLSNTIVRRISEKLLK